MIDSAVEAVPDEFLAPLLPGAASPAPMEALPRRRAAYAAFLWKRVASPRAFALDPPNVIPVGSRGVVPSWVTDFRG